MSSEGPRFRTPPVERVGPRTAVADGQAAPMAGVSPSERASVAPRKCHQGEAEHVERRKD